MKRAVFLDRDGTINVDTGYISDPKELVFISGAKKAIKLLKEKNFLIYIVTNQSGVGRGYFSIEKMRSVNDKLLSEFAKDGITIDGIFACPHHPDEGCRCRKPKPDVVHDTAKKYGIDLERSYFVGDKVVDVQTGKNAGCKTVLIKTEKTIAESGGVWIEPDFTTKNLLKAVEWIIKKNQKLKFKNQN